MTPEEGEYVTANSIVAKLKDEVPAGGRCRLRPPKAESDAEILAADKLAESEHLEAKLMEEANETSGTSSRTLPAVRRRAGPAASAKRPTCRPA